MRRCSLGFFFASCVVLLCSVGRGQVKKPVGSWSDPSPHRVQMVSVDKDVKLEVLDWGGAGRPVVLLSGLGNTAHVWDDFAVKLTGKYHVYGVTRRGFGASSSPASGYDADRLGDDVLAVLDALKLEKPVLIGHSLGGEEMSSIASRHPNRVAGLIYLDAGYVYAFYDSARGDYSMDLPRIAEEFDELKKNPSDEKVMKQLDAELPLFEKNMKARESESEMRPASSPPSQADRASFAAMRVYMTGVLGGAPPEAELHETFAATADGGVGGPLVKPSVAEAIHAGFRRYTVIPVPVLAIYAVPHSHGIADSKGDPAKVAAAAAADQAATGAQAEAFEKGVPSARVVRIAHANHYVFISNPEEVLQEINRFMGTLGSGT